MSSICFFNNKGGVGKTTLVCNIGAFLAAHFSKRVLLLDLDPQCNATQLVLGEDRLTDLFDRPDDQGEQTMLEVVRPLLMGDAEIRPGGVEPFAADQNRFGVALIPGHPRIAMIEDELGACWGDIAAGNIGAFRKTSWFNSLVRAYSGRFDLLLIDVGPSLGALNRSVLIGSDYLLTPMGCDIFSLMGIGNIAEWLHSWFRKYGTGFEQLGAEHPDAVREYRLVSDLRTRCRLVGYTVQQYITKSKQGVRRPTVAFENIRRRIPDIVTSKLSDLIDRGRFGMLDLGDIPHMYSLVPLSQSASAPIDKLAGADGLAGSQYQKQLEYIEVMKGLCQKLLASLDVTERGDRDEDRVA